MDHLRHLLVAGLTVLCFASTSIFANPTGGIVTAGSAVFDESTPGVLQVAAGDRTIIEWSSFSIASGELTQFVQPHASAAVLNRVTGGIPSTINGALQANGQVFLINPQGVLVGATGRIDAAGFIASTLDVNDSEFLAGGDLRFEGDSTARVQNLGTITASDGDIFLFARQVANGETGRLNAPNGTVGLAAGTDILLRRAGEERVVVNPSGGESGGTGVDNEGAISAVTAELKAAGGNMYALAIRNAGTVEANAVQRKGGRVFLTAAGGNVDNSGTISANIGNDGGEVKVEAAKILQNGEIRADGKPVLVAQPIADTDMPPAGDREGDPEDGGRVDLLGSQRVTLAPDSVTSAQAGSFGTGGEVYVRAMETEESSVMFLDGSEIDVSGGDTGGDGGFIDVSASGGLVFEGNFDLRATEGFRGGTILIDPRHGFVENTQTAGTTLVGNTDPSWNPPGTSDGDLQTIAFGEYTTAVDLSFNPQAGGSFSGGRFGPGSTIQLQFTGNFTVSDPFNLFTATGSPDVNLDVTTQGDIFINNDIGGAAGIAFTGDNVTILADLSSIGLIDINATNMLSIGSVGQTRNIEIRSAAGAVDIDAGMGGIFNDAGNAFTTTIGASNDLTINTTGNLEFSGVELDSRGNQLITAGNGLVLNNLTSNNLSPGAFTRFQSETLGINLSEVNATVNGHLHIVSATRLAFSDPTSTFTTMGGSGGDIVMVTANRNTRPQFSFADGELVLNSLGPTIWNINNDGRWLIYMNWPGGAGGNPQVPPHFNITNPGGNILPGPIAPAGQYDTYFGDPLNFAGDGFVFQIQADGSEPSAFTVVNPGPINPADFMPEIPPQTAIGETQEAMQAAATQQSSQSSQSWFYVLDRIGCRRDVACLAEYLAELENDLQGHLDGYESISLPVSERRPEDQYREYNRRLAQWRGVHERLVTTMRGAVASANKAKTLMFQFKNAGNSTLTQNQELAFSRLVGPLYNINNGWPYENENFGRFSGKTLFEGLLEATSATGNPDDLGAVGESFESFNYADDLAVEAAEAIPSFEAELFPPQDENLPPPPSPGFGEGLSP